MKASRWALAGVAVFAAYLALWPGRIEPVAWEPPLATPVIKAEGENDFADARSVPLADGDYGPEDLAVDQQGVVYAATHNGAVQRLGEQGFEPFVKTGGRPLGLAFGPDGALWIADAFLGLLRVAPGRTEPEVVLDRFEGEKLRYLNSVEVAESGVVFLTQSTRRFDPSQLGGTLPASILDLVEHRRTGRLLAYDPASGAARVVSDGYAYANGVALSADQSWAAVVETGDYRVWRVDLETGERRPMLENLPGFPDNIARDPRGEYFWVGVGSLRRPIADALAPYPWARAALFKLPGFLRPGPLRHGLLIGFREGEPTRVLRDPEARHPMLTGARMVDGAFWVGSLEASSVAVISPGD